MIVQVPVTNHWVDGRRLPAAPVERRFVSVPGSDWTYAHHPSITWFNGRFLAIWSNGRKDEDQPGQRVMLSQSTDFASWSKPIVLFRPGRGADGQETVLTAAGFHVHAGTLVAYAGSYEHGFLRTTLLARTTTDARHWSPALDLRVPICPNQGPVATPSGRLVICGNTTFPFTDDPSGLHGWRVGGLNPKSSRQTTDDPGSFWHVQKEAGWAGALCEGSFLAAPDGSLRMFLREAGAHAAPYLWMTESRDDAASWSTPVRTQFTNDNAKFQAGRLPDGRYFLLGNPRPQGGRNPLVVSLSEDGADFREAYSLADSPYVRRREGLWKEGEYGYPNAIVHDGWFCVIVSRQKEAIEVLRARVDAFHLR